LDAVAILEWAIQDVPSKLRSPRKNRALRCAPRAGIRVTNRVNPNVAAAREARLALDISNAAASAHLYVFNRARDVHSSAIREGQPQVPQKSNSPGSPPSLPGKAAAYAGSR
jgi:hypothetical protein